MRVDALCAVLDYTKVKMKFLNNSRRLMIERRVVLKGERRYLVPGDTWSWLETFLVGTIEGEGLLLESTW